MVWRWICIQLVVLIMIPMYVSLLVKVTRNPFKFRNLSSPTFSKFQGYPQPDTKRDAYEQALLSGNKFPCIILVNPFLDQNVGSVARVMLNFGLTELRIVEPNCDIFSENAEALSSGAFDIIRNAKVYPTLSECIADLSHVIATTNRPRYLTQMVHTPNKAAEIVLNATYQNEKVGIMFGRERDGLSNLEMIMATSMVAIPTFNHFSSLNLAQSVNIIAYELWNRNNLIHSTSPPSDWLQPKDNDRLVNRHELNYYLDRLERELSRRNFTTVEQQKINVFQSIRNVFQRTLMSKSEVSLLQGVLTTLIKPVAVESSKVLKEKEDIGRNDDMMKDEK